MRRACAVLVFLVAACGSIGVQAHTLSLAYKAGDTYRYAYHAALKYTVGVGGLTSPLNLDLKAKETVTVKSVDSTGTADVSIELSDVTVSTSVAGTQNTTSSSAPVTVEMKIGSDGHVVSVNGKAVPSQALTGLTGTEGGLITAVLPDTPVKPGDTWSKSFDQPNPVGTGSVHLVSNSKYLRDDKVGGVSTAVVESMVKTTLDMTLDLGSLAGAFGAPTPSPSPSKNSTPALEGFVIKGTATSDVQSWIDTAQRRVVKTHSSGSVDATLTINPSLKGITPVATPTSTPTIPTLTGPITFKGTQTLDLTPA